MPFPRNTILAMIFSAFISSASVSGLPLRDKDTASSSTGKHHSSGISTGPSSTAHTSQGIVSSTMAAPIVSGTSTGSSFSNSAGTSTGLAALFPLPNPVSMWTTLPGAPGALPLSDATLQPFKEMAQTKHTYSNAPDGKAAMVANYPQGSFNPSHDPRGASLDFTTALELTFGYSVMFPAGFQWNKGGKLPGVYGGDNATTATSCSGGRRDPTCFSARLMWRPNGAGELYTYLPDPSDPAFAANEKICQIPNSECNPTYGASISRGAFSFAPGEWTTVSERVKLNTAGQADGELELFVGGKGVINATGIILRDTSEGRMRGLQMETFFGGSTADWASPVAQQVFFADFSAAILATL
ncbi:hypothetical protein B0H13DRAFT_2445312 [Mycena leptocephala]|nr:hypothetical protein B0H13DRAFT_2445312 [Mycena leptocephala]